MKKIVSAIIATIVSVAFAGLVFAAEPAATGMPAGHPPISKEEKPAPAKAKKTKKAKKAKKAEKKEAAPAASAAPAAPAAPAAK